MKTMKTLKTNNSLLKTNLVTVFSGAKFLRFLEFLKLWNFFLHSRSQRDWKSFFAWISVILTLIVCIKQHRKRCLFRFLFVSKNLYCVATEEDVSIGEFMKFVSGPSSIPNLGLPEKLKVLFKHWCSNRKRICKCKPTVSTFDIASALQ